MKTKSSSNSTFVDQVSAYGSEKYRVSLIIPVYNTEEYLGDTLRSVCEQTIFAETEVIIIDDGSSDNSATICQGFAAAYENIHYYHQENAGAGAARNHGLKYVTAEFLAFLDADDILPADSLEKRLKAMHPWTDMVIGGIETFPSKTTWAWIPDLKKGHRTIDITEAPRLLAGAGPANKLFRSNFFAANGITFAEDKRFEDAFAVIPAMLRSDRITLVPDTIYKYRKRDDDSSLTDSLWTNLQGYFDHLALEQLVKDEVRFSGRARRKAAHMFMIRSIEGFLIRARENMPSEYLRAFFDQAAEIYRDIPTDLIAEISRDIEHRLMFHYLLHGDFDGYLNGRLLNVTISDNQIVALPEKQGTSRAVYTSVDTTPLLTLDKAVVFIERAVQGDGYATVSASLRIFGVREAEPGNLTVILKVGGQQVTHPVHLKLRPTELAHNYVTFEWQSRLSDNFPAPEGNLTAEIRSTYGALTLPTHHTVGLMRSSRVIKTGRWWGQLVSSPQSTLVKLITVQAESPAELAQKWNRLTFRSKLKAILKREPYWKWHLLQILTWRMRKEENWLLAERGDTASDNARILFEWLRTSQKGVKPHFVLDKNSPAWNTFSDKTGLVPHGSFRHKLLMLQARALISSQDIDNYMMPKAWKATTYRQTIGLTLDQRRVFLQHGVIHNGVGEQLHSRGTGLDMFVCSSPQEQEYLRKTSGYDSELVLSGMPRFDGLFHARTAEKSNELLVMPTWRSYLVTPSFLSESGPKESFEDSEFFEFYSKFLSDSRLHQALEQNDLKLRFLAHYEIANSFKLESQSDRVIIDDGRSTDLPTLLKTTPLLITDYSSVAFDAAFASTPVLLAHFDIERFYSEHYGKGWYEPSSMSLGPSARDVDELMVLLESAIASNFVVPEPYATRCESYFAHHDDQNTMRTFQAIKQLTQSTENA